MADSPFASRAVICEYESPAAFTRMFKRAFGTSPRYAYWFIGAPGAVKPRATIAAIRPPRKRLLPHGGNMAVTGMHHFNIRVDAKELDALQIFYCDVIGLTAGPRPPFNSAGSWLYAAGTPILHLTQMNSGEVLAPGSQQSLPEVQARFSTIDHIALTSKDPDGMIARLIAHGVPYTLTEVPTVGEVQVFCRDPSGTGIELIFPLAKADI